MWNERGCPSESWIKLLKETKLGVTQLTIKTDSRIMAMVISMAIKKTSLNVFVSLLSVFYFPWFLTHILAMIPVCQNSSRSLDSTGWICDLQSKTETTIFPTPPYWSPPIRDSKHSLLEQLLGPNLAWIAERSLFHAVFPVIFSNFRTPIPSARFSWRCLIASVLLLNEKPEGFAWCNDSKSFSVNVLGIF